MPSCITTIRSDIPHDLGQLTRNHDNGLTLTGKLCDKRMNLCLCTNINTACRFVNDQNIRIGQQPAPNQHLLLIAARQILNGRFDRRRFGVEIF